MSPFVAAASHRRRIPSPDVSISGPEMPTFADGRRHLLTGDAALAAGGRGGQQAMAFTHRHLRDEGRPTPAEAAPLLTPAPDQIPWALTSAVSALSDVAPAKALWHSHILS
jgi:hypothetical protein